MVIKTTCYLCGNQLDNCVCANYKNAVKFEFKDTISRQAVVDVLNNLLIDTRKAIIKADNAGKHASAIIASSHNKVIEILLEKIIIKIQSISRGTK